MKLTFTSNDTIYKIFKIIKKVPTGKTVEIFLEDHPLLGQPRWADAFAQELIQLHLYTTVITANKTLAEHLKQHGITAVVTHTSLREYRTQKFSSVFFSGGVRRLPSKEYLRSKLSIIAELMVLAIIIYIFRGTISPKATISIQPAVYVQPLTYSFLYHPAGEEMLQITPLPLAVPLYTGSITYRASKTIDLSSFTTALQAAKGTVMLYNTIDEEFSLLQGTTLVTNDGLLFTLDSRITIPAGTPEVPGKTRVTITANEYQENGLPIGEQGNIAKSTKLWIKNLPISRDEKKMWAEPVRAFTNGQTVISGTVVSADIENLETLLGADIHEELANIIRQYVPSDSMFVPISKEIQVIPHRFLTNAQPGQSTSFLQGTLEVTIVYPYIHKQDLVDQTKVYISQRSSSQQSLGGISIESTIFYEPRQLATGSWTIPTTVQTFRGYDFDHDNHNLLESLKKRIPGMSKKEALATLLSYPEIQDARIRLSPPWYDTLPKSADKIDLDPQQLKIDTG